MKLLRASLGLLLILTLLVGVVSPLAITAVSQLIFASQSQGSLVEKNGSVIGSVLVGQEFTSPRYFWGRLSATMPAYNAAASGASNMSPSNSRVLDLANARMEQLQKSDPAQKAKIPEDLVTASASGLDPHISLQAAYYQMPRVAQARGMKEADVRALIDAFVQGRKSGFFGNRRVNVLLLNLALDAQESR